MPNTKATHLDQLSPAKNPPIEVQAAKWFGPWTVLINRRIEGQLFHTPAAPSRT
jgi:hypothetical protein